MTDQDHPKGVLWGSGVENQSRREEQGAATPTGVRLEPLTF